jgi:ribosomal protein S18 acetylase RimI-like enzyme
MDRQGASGTDAVEVRHLPATTETAEAIARMQKEIYPEAMQEDSQAVLSVLRSTDLSRGVYVNGALVGYGLVQKTSKKGVVYLYDIAVLPSYQRRGLGSKLAREILGSAGSRGLKIVMHVRPAGYALFGNRERVREMGYDVAEDKLLPDWYYREFGIHEDAHRLVLAPLSVSVARKSVGETG